MPADRRFVTTVLAVILTVLAAPALAQEDPVPIDLPAILDWKNIRSSALAPDGEWLAYVVAPTEGDSEIVVRSLTTEVEHRFDIGELPMFGGGRIEFSADGEWLAFEIRPARAAAAASKKPLPNGAGLVELATGEMTRFERVRTFAFGGDTEPWLGLHKMVPDGREDEDWTGSDLFLRRLQEGTTLTVGNASEFGFDESGGWLAVAIGTEGRVGNGVQLHDLNGGRVLALDSSEASYERLAWTDEGDAFAVLRGVKDEQFEDARYSLLAFTDLDADSPRRIVYVPAEDESFPDTMTINPHHDAIWNEARDALVFRIHELSMTAEAAAAAEEKESAEANGEEIADEDLDTADLVIWHWKDRRLQSRQQVQERRDRNFGYLSTYRIGEDRFVRLADEDIDDANPAPKHRWAIAREDDGYERQGSLDGRRLTDVWVIDMADGSRRKVLEGSRYVFAPSPAGTHLLHYSDGDFFSLDLATGASVNLTGGLGVPFWNDEDDHNVVKPPRFQAGFGWSDDGEHVLLSDGWDVWRIGADGSDPRNLTVNGRSEQIRYQRAFRLDEDSEGVDTSAPIFVSAYGEWTKKGGIGRLAADRPGVDMLLWDDASFASLMKAEDADVYLYSRETHADPRNWHVADATLSNGRQVTDSNPQQAGMKWSAGVRLVDYESARGAKLQGALYLPADYEPGRSYPTIVYIYEKLSQRANMFWAPTANGFNKSVYTSNGYAVLMPDIVYEVNDPGMSAVWSVLPALDAAIATGVVDPDAVGLHGHSWGGYQTSHLITQTDRFAAAIAGAPLTNMISMYSLIYKNSGGGNGAIFEASQGRFTGGPWEVTDAYVRNSPVYHAANVTTPLIILHNDKDGAVDFTQGVEYYNTLRRLDKNVVMLQYVGENHGLRDPANRKDYTVRMREFFDHYLRDLGMPGWLQEGVPHLEHEDHLEARARAIAEEVAAARKAQEEAQEETQGGEDSGAASDGSR
jgi:dipeptidyl aminopeptidase/acylaminoacyl peptidase